MSTVKAINKSITLRSYCVFVCVEHLGSLSNSQVHGIVLLTLLAVLSIGSPELHPLELDGGALLMTCACGPVPRCSRKCLLDIGYGEPLRNSVEVALEEA